jgi:hypothetical protein
MCAACVAQGTVYVGGAVGTLRLMAARAAWKRAGSRAVDAAAHDEPSPTDDRRDDDSDRAGEYASTS